jgi:hypothetical protein
MITATEWDAFLDDLQQTLDKFAVPEAEQAELKAITASTRADIVVQGAHGRRAPKKRLAATQLTNRKPRQMTGAVSWMRAMPLECDYIL